MEYYTTSPWVRRVHETLAEKSVSAVLDSCRQLARSIDLYPDLFEERFNSSEAVVRFLESDATVDEVAHVFDALVIAFEDAQ